MVDYSVSDRQQIGPWWSARPDDLTNTKGLMERQLELEPHPSWNMPDSINWDADPFGQKNWRFQLHCLKWLDPVRRVALQDTELSEKAQIFWNEIVESWIDNNLEGNDKYAWMDMADGVRTIELVLGAPLASEHLQPKLQNAISTHLSRLEDLSTRSVGNHALHQLQGLFVAARFLEDDRRATSTATEILQFFENEYDDQGTNAEGAVSYHDLNYNWWKNALKRLTVEGFSTGDSLERLEKSRKNIVHFVRPDGFLEMLGDTSEAKRLSNDGSSHTQYVLSAGKEGTIPSSDYLDLHSGYSLGRSGWGEKDRPFDEETFYTLRYGQTRAVHGHDDSGSITIFSQGIPWVVDPGMYAYQNHPFRPYFLSRKSHNVVLATDLASQGDVPALQWSVHDNYVDGYAVQLNSYEGFLTRRIFIYFKLYDAFIVFDEVERTDESKLFPNFVQRWNFHPDTQVTLGKITATLRSGKKAATMRWLKRPKLTLSRGVDEPMSGWFSPSYGVSVPAPVIDAQPSKRGDLSWMTVISVGEFDLIPLDFYRRGEEFIFCFDNGQKRQVLTVSKEGSVVWAAESPLQWSK